MLPHRKMQLPPWRKDWGVDMVSMSYHRSGMIATGRRDGQVLLWNVLTGAALSFCCENVLANVMG